MENKQEKEKEIFEAVEAHQSDVELGLSFEKGDAMYLLKRESDDVWYMRSQRTGECGYVLRSFVARQKAVESEEWFFGKMTRSRAIEHLSSPEVPEGSFLVREGDSGEMALSIRSGKSMGRGGLVKHYRIKRLADAPGYFIATGKNFKSLQDLVRFYRDPAHALCCLLITPAPRLPQENWEVPRDVVVFKQILGTGSFGEVWKGEYREKMDVAIKKMKKGSKGREEFLKEAEILKQCIHPNLIQLIAVCTQDDPFYIMMEYMDNGSLLGYLQKVGNTIDIQTLVNMAAQVANGMKFMEEKKIVHRDLAARNVLVGEKVSRVPIVKVADFGMARKLTDKGVYEGQTEEKIPVRWTAPEAAFCGRFTVKSDVWSYGILVYEMMTKGQQPYCGLSNLEAIDQVNSGYRLPMPPGCPKELHEDVMLKCWHQVPEMRPSFVPLYNFLFNYIV